MNQHWQEPQPFGEAQRAGLMQLRTAQQLQAYNQAQQVANSEYHRGPLGSRLGPSVMHRMHSTLGTGGMIGLGLAVGGLAGFFIGQAYHKRQVRKLIGGNPEDEHGPYDGEWDDEIEDALEQANNPGEAEVVEVIEAEEK